MSLDGGIRRNSGAGPWPGSTKRGAVAQEQKTSSPNVFRIPEYALPVNVPSREPGLLWGGTQFSLNKDGVASLLRAFRPEQARTLLDDLAGPLRSTSLFYPELLLLDPVVGLKKAFDLVNQRTGEVVDFANVLEIVRLERNCQNPVVLLRLAILAL